MKLIAPVLALGLLSTAAIAQDRMAPANKSDWAPVGAAPASNFTVSNYYKQDVYDRSDNKIGSVDDVLIDRDGHVTAVIIGVGGFLGIGEKDVAAQFQNVKMTKKNDKWYLVMDATKEQLKSAPGVKYDKVATTWVPDTK